MKTRSATAWGLLLAALFVSPRSNAQFSTNALSAGIVVNRNAVPAEERGDSSNVWNYSVGNLSFLDPVYYLPAFLRNEALLKRYIRDRRFLQLRRMINDTVAVDIIFLRACDIADGDVSQALFVATLATFDHFRVGVKIPILGVLYFPLTFESDSVYKVRYAHLPRRVLPDSLGRRTNDRDKLQHFFGSAYLTYNLNSKEVARFLGDFIEWGEPLFIVGGEDDERDKYANRLGREFGMRLLEGEDVFPSDILWGK